jgi:putative transposase
VGVSLLPVAIDLAEAERSSHQIFERAPVRKRAPGAVRRTSLERGRGPATLRGMTQRSPFRYFKTSPEVIRWAVMLYVAFPSR